MSAVYYLNILLLFLLAASSNIDIGVESGTISQYASEFTKKILMATSLPFQDCGSRFLIKILTISSCNTIPCEMYSGTTVDVNVVFDDGGKNTTFLKHQVRWIFNAIKTEAYITPDPCVGNQHCITSDSDGKSYNATVFVDDTLPVISGTMLWEATNEYNQDVICFKVPIYLVRNVSVFDAEK